MKKTTILLVDDHYMVREGVKSALVNRTEYEVLGEASNGRQALELSEMLRPDMVILDISLPDVNGVEVAHHLKHLLPETRIIIYTMHSDTEYVTELCKAGISAYILKEDPVSDLLLALDEAKRGGNYFGNMTLKVLTARIKDLKSRERQKSGFEKLSQRERDVLLLLAEGRNIKKIANQLDISPKTVESHKYNIMEKLNVSTLSELTKIALRKRLIK